MARGKPRPGSAQSAGSGGRPRSAKERVVEGLVHANERRLSVAETLGKANKLLKRSNALQEMLIYGVFLVTFCLVVFAPRSSEPYEVQSRLQDLVTRAPIAAGSTRTFYDVSTVEEMYAWMAAVFLPVVFPERWPNGEPMAEEDKVFVDGVQRRLGTVRLRQLRVRDDSCTIASMFEDEFKGCYGRYSESIESKESYNGTRSHWATQYHWQSAEELETFNWEGETKVTYAGSGFVVDLPPNLYNATDVVAALNESRWIDLHTRAVFLDMNLYNANVDLFCISRLLIEFLPTGAIVTSATFRTLPLIQTWRIIARDGVSTFDTALLGLEGVLYLLVLRYMVHAAREFYHSKHQRGGRRSYFSSIWNVLDLSNIVLFLVVLALRVTVLLRIMDMEEELSSTDGYVNLQPISFFARQVDNVNSFNAVLCFLRVFRYIRVNRKLAQFTDTLALASGEMVILLLIIAIITCGYGIAFHMAFGHDVADYRDFAESVFTLFQITLGEFDFSALRVSNRYLGPVLFMSFMLLVGFTVVSMFLSIVDNAYERVRERNAGVTELDPLTRDMRAMRALFRHKVATGKESVKKMMSRTKVDPNAVDSDEETIEDYVDAASSVGSGSRPGSAAWFGSRPGSAASRPRSGGSARAVGKPKASSGGTELTRAEIRRRLKQDEEMGRRVALLEDQQVALMKTLTQLAEMLKEDEFQKSSSSSSAAAAGPALERAASIGSDRPVSGRAQAETSGPPASSSQS